MSTTRQTERGGVGFAALLTLLFIALKLLGVIAWSWWWVLAPLWIPLALVIVGGLLAAIAGCIVLLFSKKRRRR